jgi:ABC-type multidrug transport system ATPase subunit
MRKLADHGQAVLATIHQPSALLFQQFDRLLLLRRRIWPEAAVVH